MSNTNGFAISVKEYAERRGKTVQAVYQQMKRKENAARLKGHIITERIGNKDVKCLDEEAVAILDEASNSTPTIVLQEDLKDQLTVVTDELKKAQIELAAQVGKVQLLKEMLEDKEQKLLALAEPKSQIDGLQKQNAMLSGKITGAEQRAVDANAEAYKARVYAAEMRAYAKLPFFVRWFTEEPVEPAWNSHQETTDVKMGQLCVEEEVKE